MISDDGVRQKKKTGSTHGMSELIRVMDLGYRVTDYGETVVYLTGRSESGEAVTRFVYGCEPYFYVDSGVSLTTNDDVLHCEGWDDSSGERYRSYDGDGLLQKVVTKTPEAVGDIADELSVPTWEADIPFYRRCAIDYGLSGYVVAPDDTHCEISEIETHVDPTTIIEPRVGYVDIEVEPVAGGFDKLMEDCEARVTALTAFDSYEGDYTLFLLDAEGEASGAAVRELLRDHWGDERGEVPVEFVRCDTERDLLRDFVSWVRDRRPDVLTGWNYVDFDHEYLLKRIREACDYGTLHSLSVVGGVSMWGGDWPARAINGLPAFDLMDALTGAKMSYTKWRSKALDYVAEEILGVGKVESISADSWNTEIDRFAAYNIIDVQLCVELNEERRVLEFFLQLAELCHVHLTDTHSEMRLIDGFIMSRAGPDEILPSIADKDIPENAGGLVLPPSDGIKEWVAVVDVKSLYPSSIITWNLSPETIHWYEEEEPGDDEEFIDIPWVPNPEDVEGIPDDGDIQWGTMWASLEKRGIVPKYLGELFPEREALKAKRNEHEPGTTEYVVYDIQQAAVKVIMNAMYGVTSMDYWRMATYGLGDAVTSASRYVLLSGVNIARENGYSVAYGDTDSALVTVEAENKAEAIEAGKALEESINSEIDRCVDASGLVGRHPLLTDDLHGSNRSCLVYEFEKLYRRFIQVGKKKRYAGNIVWKEGKDVDEIDVTGFESRRSSSPELTSEAQPEILHRILRGDGFDGISDYVSGLCDEIEAGELEIRAIAKPSSLGKPLDSYGNTQTARACRNSNRLFGHDWREGGDPFLYFVAEVPPGAEGVDVIALEWNEEIPEGYTLDYDSHIERAIRKPMESIFDEVGWSWGELRGGRKAGDALEDDW